jgi:hypothetical protein
MLLSPTNYEGHCHYHIKTIVISYVWTNVLTCYNFTQCIVAAVTFVLANNNNNDNNNNNPDFIKLNNQFL